VSARLVFDLLATADPAGASASQSNRKSKLHLVEITEASTG